MKNLIIAHAKKGYIYINNNGNIYWKERKESSSP